MNSSLAYGVDIGGTFIKLGLLNAQGEILAKSEICCGNFFNFSSMMAHIVNNLKELSEPFNVTPTLLGLSLPFNCSRETGHISEGMTNLSWITQKPDTSISQYLSQHLNVHVAFENDGICAAIGQMLYGEMGDKNFAVMTLGTGIGGALVLGNRVILGRDGRAPEFGAMVLDVSAGGNRKGIIGSLESLAGGKSFVTSYAKRTGQLETHLSVKKIFERALQNEATALDEVNKMANYIAQALGTLINTASLDVCVLGGGIASADSFLLERIKGKLNLYTWPHLLSHAQVIISPHGNDLGLLGVNAIVQKKVEYISGNYQNTVSI